MLNNLHMFFGQARKLIWSVAEGVEDTAIVDITSIDPDLPGEIFDFFLDEKRSNKLEFRYNKAKLPDGYLHRFIVFKDLPYANTTLLEKI